MNSGLPRPPLPCAWKKVAQGWPQKRRLPRFVNRLDCRMCIVDRRVDVCRSAHDSNTPKSRRTSCVNLHWHLPSSSYLRASALPQTPFGSESADSAACWDQSRSADRRPADLQTSAHLSTIHIRQSNPDETTGSLLLWGNPYAIFFSWGGWAAVHPRGQHPSRQLKTPRKIILDISRPKPL